MTYPKLKPFKGIVYNQNKTGDLSKVVTPPYDVINPEMQDEFYARSPYNFVRIDLTKEAPPIRYEIAGKIYQQWLSEKILVQDNLPAFYCHHQTFSLPNGSKITRKGFFGVRRIEDFSEGGIKPHEKTLEGPKIDRLHLTRAVKANLSPVFSLYSDPEKRFDALVDPIKSNAPDIHFQTIEGETHELWRVTDPNVCAKVDDILGAQPLFIADGHHRYETALNYRNEQQNQNSLYTLMYFSNLDDEGLIILPIHRALHNLKNFNIKSFIEKLSSTFEVKPLKSPDQLQRINGFHSFALLTRDPNQSYLIRLSKEKWKKSKVAQTVSPALVDLDVTVLHRLIFEEMLGISQEAQAKQENIIYWKDTGKAINETRKGKCDVTFLLNPTQVGDMRKVAMAGEKMPQKSTYFYPKILSGLVIHSLS